jgi:hypothetical protein
LANSTVTFGNATVALGGSIGAIGNLNLNNVTVNSVNTTFPNNFLANSSTTLGNAVLTLGSTTANIGNVTFANIAVQSGTIDNTPIGATTPTTIKTTVLTVTTSSALGNASANQLNNTPIGNNSAANGTFTNLTSNVSSTLANLSSSNATITGGTISNVSLANITSNLVTTIVAGTNITLSPANGVGTVTVNSTGGGGTSSNISNDTTTAAFEYPLFSNVTTGTATTIFTSNASLRYKPSTGEFQAQAITALNGVILNSSNINTSTTIPTGYNAVSVGPETLANGVTVTVSSGSRWLIL